MSAEHEDLLTPISNAEQNPNESDEEVSLTSTFRELLGSDSATMDYQSAARCVTMLIQRLDPTLDLSRLLRWVVVEDIYEGAEQLAAELGREIRLTKTENSTSGGRIVETAEGSILLLPESTLRYLIDGPEGMAHFTINLLHHELCHVHDEAVRKSMPGWHDQMTGRPLTNRMLGPMIWLWDEYSANRRSTKTIQPAVEQHQFELVVKEYPTARENVAEAIESWRDHGDMGRLFSELTSSFGHLFKLLGYSLGSAAGRGISLEQFDPVSYQFLRETWLASLLEEESIEQLNVLYETFGNWTGIEVFDEFAETCRLTFWDAGIHIYANHDNLRAEII